MGLNDLLVPDRLPRPQDYLAALDIFVLLAKGDVDPRSLAEAMAAGLPVIATEAGDIPDMLGGGSRVFAIRPGDEPALVAALRKLGADVGLRKKLGAANQSRALQCFDEKVMLDLYSRLYGAPSDEKERSFERNSPIWRF